MDLWTQKEMRGKGAGQPGFTLMEITIAIMILAGALVVLLGLQTSTVQKAIRDRKQQEAMLLARSILAAIEVNTKDIDPQDTTLSADKMVQKLAKTNVDKRDEEPHPGFQANLHVEELEIPIPSGDPNALPSIINMKQVLLTIYWGERSDSELRVVYLIPGKTP